MSTDPFSDIAFQQEIGQPTYAELIYTEVRTGRAFAPSNTTVENSLARLAFGKQGPYRDVEPQTPPRVTATPPNPTLRRYNIRESQPQPTLQALRTQRVQDEFRSLLFNPGTSGDPNPDCDQPITGLRTLIEWDGVPRQPINVFNMLIRFVIRDPNDPFNRTVSNVLALADGRLATVTPTSCSTGNTCDFWKQQGTSGNSQALITSGGLNPATLQNISAGQLASVTNRSNWLWSIPASVNASGQDALATVWPDGPTGLLESIEVLFLIHNVNAAGTPTTPICSGPYQCGPDPAQNFDVVIRYINGRGKSKEFRKTFSRASLYQVTATFPLVPNTWDTITAIGNGVRGTTARWESAKFVLDSVDGSGLDQCSVPLQFSTSGRGQFNFKKPTLRGRGQVEAVCDAAVQVEEMNKGQAVNEIQSIILPEPSGGHWTLSFAYAGQLLTTENIAWNAPANVVRTKLANLANIGLGNVRVTGNGTAETPFDVEFINLLGGRDLRPLRADGSNLTGSAVGFCTKLSTGTSNERQTITKSAGVGADLLLAFNNVQSIPIRFNASLNAMQAALEGISTIGAGNVTVTGNTTNREVDYQGPWYIDFIGALASQNVPQFVIQTTGYSVVTNWQGGTGVNDVQKITTSASSGSFTLTLVNPDSVTEGGGETVTTGSISVNAGATQVRNRILAVANWLSESDIVVTRLNSGGNPDVSEWTVEFTGDYASRSIPLMAVNGSGLDGAAITVRETVKGSGVSERQKVNLFRAGGGSYRLIVTIDGVSATTVQIPWNADAEGVQLALQALPHFPAADDVTVREMAIRGDGIVASFFVIFNRRFGDVPLMGSVNNLLCNQLPLATVGPPPYDYNLPECADDQVSCSPGSLLCRPGEGDDLSIPEPFCCDEITIRDSANHYREVVLQRDLFDPNSRTGSGGPLTIRDMAVLKGLRPSQYNAYLRDFRTGVLRPVEINLPVESQMSVLLINSDIDTKATRDRLGRELKRRPEVLPSRMS